MDEYYGYDLDSKRGLSQLELDIAIGKLEMKAAADILRGHPCADEFIDRFPDLAQEIQEPPDDTSPST
ncbi:hypothetical protein [Streptomyces camelliae]|uniref:Uncharacterized protein n=1 Tax=Streptomyces camelliae TaxID=3004093 RepID=A0ABY7P8W9_9ACTN|nr:hypothetical protein [Streptomyces sp. HUAS 2-6]WBO66077.1 hypothetical protein O1G22_26345 [Streptomyces sp. HUAS 2-6]